MDASRFVISWSKSLGPVRDLLTGVLVSALLLIGSADQVNGQGDDGGDPETCTGPTSGAAYVTGSGVITKGSLKLSSKGKAGFARNFTGLNGSWSVQFVDVSVNSLDGKTFNSTSLGRPQFCNIGGAGPSS